MIINAGDGVSTIKTVYMEPGNMKVYCKCDLPIKMTRNTSENFKIWRCSYCGEKVDPHSKMLNRVVEYMTLSDATKNEKEIALKINEILDLIKANGGMA